MESVKISVSSSSCVDEPTVQSNMPTSELTDNYGYYKKIHKRNFQEKWKLTFPWLLHNTIANFVYCKYCREAYSKNLVKFSSKYDLIFWWTF